MFSFFFFFGLMAESLHESEKWPKTVNSAHCLHLVNRERESEVIKVLSLLCVQRISLRYRTQSLRNTNKSGFHYISNSNAFHGDGLFFHMLLDTISFFSIFICFKKQTQHFPARRKSLFSIVFSFSLLNSNI